MTLLCRIPKHLPLGQHLLCLDCHSKNAIKNSLCKYFFVATSTNNDALRQNFRKPRFSRKQRFNLNYTPKDFNKLHRRDVILEEVMATRDYDKAFEPKSVDKSDGYECVKMSSPSDEFGSLDPTFVEEKYRDRTEKSKEPKSKKKFSKDSRNSSASKSLDHDVFGTLASDGKYYQDEYATQPYVKEEECDDTEMEFKPKEERISVQKYTDNLKSIIKDGRLKEALMLFEEEMLKENRMKPSPYTFSVLINGCAAVGYTKKAFGLFKKMRDRGMKPTPATITGLFISCSHSPMKEDALRRALDLREKIKFQGWTLNTVHYHSMIKAFGRCGDISTAFEVADEMIKEGLMLRTETFNFLLTACISCPNDGLKYAIEVWRKMRQKNLSPNIYSYNLLLRAIRDCNIGDLEESYETIIGSKSVKDLENDSNSDQSFISEETSAMKKTEQNQLIQSEIQLDNVPDVLSPVPISSAVFKLKEMPRPEDRLALFGGMPGLLSQMVRDEVTPNIKTFSQLLDVIPNKLSSEEHLLNAIEEHKLIPDVDFCNMLIKRRAYRQDDDAAESMIEVIQKYGLSPNIMTYGVMALVCRSRGKSERLLKDIDKAGHVVNIEILGTLLRSACVRKDFEYILRLMLKVKKKDLAANPEILHHLEKIIKKMENEGDENLTEEKTEHFEKFKMWYKSWLRKIAVDLPQHPWNQYNYKFDSYLEKQKAPNNSVNVKENT